MKQIRFQILCFVIFYFPVIAFSQVEIKGLIKDAETPLAFANVVMKDSADAIKFYDITNEDGTFKIIADKGRYRFEVSTLGYQDYVIDLNVTENKTLEDIILEKVAENLDEVVVKYRRPLIEQKVDRLVYNVENSIAAKGGNAVDALRAAPGLTVSRDGVGLIGRGVSRVMIDGRLLQLTGEELMDFLNSIATEDIKKIEVFANPPARYEAAGSGGLINIIYKKGVGDFWKNTITSVYEQNAYSIYTLRNSYLYSKNKFKLNLSLSGGVGDERQVEFFNTNYPSGPWTSDVIVKQARDNFSGRLAIDYDITEKTSFGVQYLGNFNRPDRADRSITNIFNTTNSLDSIFDSQGRDDRTINSNIYNFHWISEIGDVGAQVSLDLDYFDYTNRLDRDYQVNTFSANDEFLGINQAAINLSDQDIENYSVTLNVEHPNRIANFSYGGRISAIRTVNDLRVFDTEIGEPVFIPAQSDEFTYQENIQALYINGNKKISDKIEVQAGLRLETTQTEGFSESANQRNTNDYAQLFPTLYISYRKSEDHVFGVNYGRRIRRPGFRQLNPFRFFINSNSFSEGNPFLQPSFAHNFNFNYNYKGSWMVNVFYTNQVQEFGYLFSSDPETNVQAIIRRNYQTSNSAGLSQTYTRDITSWWQSRNTLGFVASFREFTDDEIDAVPKDGAQLWVDFQNDLSIGSDTKVQVRFWYNSPAQFGLFDYGDNYSLDFGFKRSFLESKDLQLSIFVQDILDTGSLDRQESEVNGVDVFFARNYSRRFLRVSLSYNFGNNKINVRQRNFGNDEERYRTY